MIIAEIASVKFKRNPNKHTAAYEQIGEMHNDHDWERDNSLMIYQAVVATDVPDAVGKLSAFLHKELKERFDFDKVVDFDYTDFTFKIKISKVNSNGVYSKIGQWTKALDSEYTLNADGTSTEIKRADKITAWINGLLGDTT